MRTRRRWASPSTIRWSTHSRRIVPISRSAKPFCHGEPAEILVANAHGAQAAGDDDVAAAAGQRASDRGGQAVSAFGGAHLGFGVLGLVDPRKRLLVPIRPHDGPAIVGKFCGQFPGWVVPQQKCGHRHGGANGFEVPGRDVDDQARGRAADDPLKRMRDGFGRPVSGERTILVGAHGHGLCCALPFAARAVFHTGARDDRAAATTGIGKKVEWTGSSWRSGAPRYRDRRRARTRLLVDRRQAVTICEPDDGLAMSDRE
jgi:hypothetical protein